MKKILLSAAILGAAIAMTGCSTMSAEVFEAQPGVYTVSGENWMTYDSGDVRMDLMKQAKAYCDKMGKKLYVLETSQSDAVQYGKTATATVNFKCVE